MSILQNSEFLRVAQITGNPKAVPPIPGLIPIGRSTWWAGVKSGRFPKPVKLGPRTTLWRAEAIQDVIDHPEKYALTDV